MITPADRIIFQISLCLLAGCAVVMSVYLIVKGLMAIWQSLKVAWQDYHRWSLDRAVRHLRSAQNRRTQKKGRNHG